MTGGLPHALAEALEAPRPAPGGPNAACERDWTLGAVGPVAPNPLALRLRGAYNRFRGSGALP
jgi:hypothetical protein